MPKVSEQEIMDNWITVQPCPKCGLKRLTMSGGALYTDPLQYMYTCGNDECGASGTFGYKRMKWVGESEPEIIIHLPSEAEKEMDKELGGIIDLLREHGDMSGLDPQEKTDG